MLLIIIPVFIFVTLGLVAFALIRPGPNQLAQRLQAYDPGFDQREVDELSKPFSERVLWPVVARIAKLVTKASPQQMHDKLAAELEKAGNPVSPATLMTLKGVLVVALPALFGLQFLLAHRPASLLQIGVLVVLLLLGWKVPDLWVSFKVDARKSAIQKRLPDALDLITVSVEAGLAFDAAIAKVVEKTKGPLAEELGRVLQEMNLGKLRRDALRDMGNRTGVADLKSFVAAMIQADQMGIPIGNILRVQSDELRVRRRQRAEELANKAPVKMLIPLVFMILPAMLMVLMGPAAYSIYQNYIVGVAGK
ncbi:MAG: type II secretion system F family protein [Chloroflexi bacterium]|nr:type II secretion system F family protein [Chloroflexota bacterium]